MTVQERLMQAAWPRETHRPKWAAQDIEAQEKVLTYYVKNAMKDHRTAILNAEAMTEREAEDMTFALKRMLEKSLELVAWLQGEDMATVAGQMADTYERKNKDYGDSFGETMRLYGVVAGAVRIHDKVQRMLQLMSGHRAEVRDESLADTVRDLGTYAAMVMCWIEAGRVTEANN
jgi:hypothetical protein